MFERETKREKILEARQREIRLKERSRSEQSREDEAKEDREDDPEQLIAKAESDFYSLVETEMRRRERMEDTPQVRRDEGWRTFKLLNVIRSDSFGLICFIFFFPRRMASVMKAK